MKNKSLENILKKIGLALAPFVLAGLLNYGVFAENNSILSKYEIPQKFWNYKSARKRSTKQGKDVEDPITIIYPNYKMVNYKLEDGSEVGELYQDKKDKFPCSYVFYDSKGKLIAEINDPDKDGLNESAHEGKWSNQKSQRENEKYCEPPYEDISEESIKN